MSNYGKRGCKKKEREEQEKSPSASLRANPPAEDLVRSSGFEPPRYCYRQPLKLVRLPVPPRPHRGKDFIVAAPEKTGKAREKHWVKQPPEAELRLGRRRRSRLRRRGCRRLWNHRCRRYWRRGRSRDRLLP